MSSLHEILGDGLEILRQRGTGGALVQRVLAPGLDPSLFTPPGATGAEAESRAAEARDAFAALAAYLEELLTGAGVLAHEYVCFVARRRA